MPVCNAAQTLQDTVRRIPRAVDRRILVDDGSQDETPSLAGSVDLDVHSRLFAR